MDKVKKIPELRFPGFEGEWHSQTIGEMFEMKLRAVPKPHDFYKSLGIRSHFKGTFQRLENDPKKNDMDTLFQVKENDLVVNITFAWEGAVAIASKSDDNGLVSQRFPTYENDKSKLEIDFFRFLFPNKDFKNVLELISPGGAGRNRVLKKSDFLKIKFSIPTLIEQQKIASFLTSVDQKLTQLKKKKALLEQYKAGVMQQIFSQQIRFKDDEGREFPEWEEKRLEELGETYNGLSGKTKEHFGQGQPYIQYKQIFDDSRIDISRFEYVCVGNKEKQNRVQFGDVFFTVSSETPDEVGMASVLLDHVETLYLNSFCFGYRPKTFEMLNPFFARYIFRSKFFRKKMGLLAQGSTRFNMSKSQLMKLPMFFPCSEEQIKIATFLSATDDKIHNCSDTISRLEQWKKGLLQRMFC